MATDLKSIRSEADYADATTATALPTKQRRAAFH